MRWFRLNIRLPWPGYHAITLSHMGHSHDNYIHLELMYNGRMYGKFYKNWKLKPIKEKK